MILTIHKKDHSPETLKKILLSHPEIKFVSLVGIDLSGNDTDEKIPISLFLKDIEAFLKGSIQTDGSSVVLPGIATLNNAKVDMIPDPECDWFIDYNYENIDSETNLPIGTLRIPCYLLHENKPVDSRSVLRRSIKYLKTTLLDLFNKYPKTLESFGIKYEDIDDIIVTSATELEFWVKTPNDVAQVEELSTSQVLQEQYWTKTRGAVRTALEQTLIKMEKYGFEPEMGHKEVGGVKAKIGESGNLTHIMEQLEVDWKYSDAVQAADNEIFIKELVRETFRSNGLDVTFLAKPVEGVAGSGEHTHISISLKTKDNKVINLFTSTDKNFLSVIGFGALMGILKNYEVVNPFVSSTNDSLRRLQPGFEAPICIVTSLGHSIDVPSRNRSVLIGLVRDLNNPFSTRFELRAPNPHTNTFLCLAALCMTMVDGIKYAVSSGKTEQQLLEELSKGYGEDADYLEKFRVYRSEKNVFEEFSEEERIKLFGKSPSTVYENILNFEKYPEKFKVLQNEDVFTDKIVSGFKIAVITRWLVEIKSRIINNYMNEIRQCKKLHSDKLVMDLDLSYWIQINSLKKYIMKDTHNEKSLFTKIKEAIENKDYKKVSELQIELNSKMSELREIYCKYEKNLLDIGM